MKISSTCDVESGVKLESLVLAQYWTMLANLEMHRNSFFVFLSVSLYASYAKSLLKELKKSVFHNSPPLKETGKCYTLHL